MSGPFRTWLMPVLLAPVLVQAATETGNDPETGLRFWQWSEGGVSVRLVQRLPDQIRGFFLARGFHATEADHIARACVFQTIFRDDDNHPVDFDLHDWRVLHQGAPSGLRVREDWDRRWPADMVPRAARIALRWSLLPTRQHFEPGDYNWGMSVYGLAPGSHFDLHLMMHIGGQQVEALLPDIECPRDGDQP